MGLCFQPLNIRSVGEFGLSIGSDDFPIEYFMPPFFGLLFGSQELDGFEKGTGVETK